jgi:hypothetical protein
MMARINTLEMCTWKRLSWRELTRTRFVCVFWIAKSFTNEAGSQMEEYIQIQFIGVLPRYRVCHTHSLYCNKSKFDFFNAPLCKKILTKNY